MVNLGQHLNIVNLLGAITKHARKRKTKFYIYLDFFFPRNDLCMEIEFSNDFHHFDHPFSIDELTAIVEYCPYGNMQSFLVQHRPYFIDQIVRGQDMIDPTITVPQQRSEYTNTLTRNNT